MPLALGAGAVPDTGVPQQPGTGTKPIKRPPKALALPTAVWIDPTGKVWPLTDVRRVDKGGPGWFTPAPGPSGIDDATGIEITRERRERGGTVLRHVAPLDRTIMWPFFIEGARADGQPADHMTYLSRYRGLGKAFTSTSRLGPGLLVFSRPDGSARAIPAYYEDGWKPDQDSGITHTTLVVQLYCPDGYWRALEPTPILRRGGSGVAASFFRRFPRVSSSQALGAAPVNNPGDVEAWPYWTLTGPFGSVTARNQTRDEAWTLDATKYLGRPLAPGEVVTVNTETGAIFGPEGPDGRDWAGAIDWTQSVLWRLDAGAADVDFTVTGATSETVVEASFYARYEMG